VSHIGNLTLQTASGHGENIYICSSATEDDFQYSIEGAIISINENSSIQTPGKNIFFNKELDGKMAFEIYCSLPTDKQLILDKYKFDEMKFIESQRFSKIPFPEEKFKILSESFGAENVRMEESVFSFQTAPTDSMSLEQMRGVWMSASCRDSMLVIMNALRDSKNPQPQIQGIIELLRSINLTTTEIPDSETSPNFNTWKDRENDVSRLKFNDSHEEWRNQKQNERNRKLRQN
jgi:hypothetical protein